MGCSRIQDASRSSNIWKIATWTFTFCWFYSIRWVYSTPTSFLLPLVYAPFPPNSSVRVTLCATLPPFKIHSQNLGIRKTLGFTPRFWTTSERYIDRCEKQTHKFSHGNVAVPWCRWSVAVEFQWLFRLFFIPGWRIFQLPWTKTLGNSPFWEITFVPLLPLSLADFLPDCWDRWDRWSFPGG